MRYVIKFRKSPKNSMEAKSCAEQLKDHVMFRGDMIADFKYLKGHHRKLGKLIFYFSRLQNQNYWIETTRKELQSRYQLEFPNFLIVLESKNNRTFLLP